MPPLNTSPKEQLAKVHQTAGDRYWQNAPIAQLMKGLSEGTDKIIIGLFNAHFDRSDPVTLFAVGGYGRQELHPGSDIDLLVVANRPKKHQRQIEHFLQSVFDLNIEVGHSVRTPKGCRDEAKNDITVATALFERRKLAGSQDIVEKTDKYMSSRRLWPSAKFFAAKLSEQTQRHKDYDNIEYNLEPNVKTSPGGLRDIHTILWICKREFDTADPAKLVKLGVLRPIEKKWLVEGRNFIWWVRFGLHLIAERKQDHLQFAHQRELAERLGFSDSEAKLSVEQFMYDYYRHILSLNRGQRHTHTALQ